MNERAGTLASQNAEEQKGGVNPEPGFTPPQPLDSFFILAYKKRFVKKSGLKLFRHAGAPQLPTPIPPQFWEDGRHRTQAVPLCQQVTVLSLNLELKLRKQGKNTKFVLKVFGLYL